MLEPIQNAQPAFNIFYFIKKYWYIIFLILFTIPSVYHSVQIAIQTNNPSYPVFNLAEKILASDKSINDDVNLLRTNPEALIGMSHPTEGIWEHAKYYWLFFWNVIYETAGNILFILLPFTIIYFFFNLTNNSLKMRNLVLSTLFFIAYLFVANTIILVTSIARGQMQINLSENNFSAYWVLVKNIMPFHGIFNLISYTISSIIH